MISIRASAARVYTTNVGTWKRSSIICLSNRPFSLAASDSSGNGSVFQEQHHGLDLSDPYCNVSHHIASRVGTNLHQRSNHPLCTIKDLIHDYWNTTSSKTGTKFDMIQDLSPVVSVQQNFDQLRIPLDHSSRQKTDTYYLNTNTVLRCHTSAHQVDLLKQNKRQFLVTGDVYRRDEIDASHYPVFHQMEGVKLFDTALASQDEIQADLQQGLVGMARALFGPETPVRWVDAYFPFTHPSLELEVYYQNDWLEVLGCGVIHPDILCNAGIDPNETSGWAFGLGLERLAMVLFQIPDIRLFWTTDKRFHNQFQAGKITSFQPYSKYPPCLKDMSFWLAPENDENHNAVFCQNDLSEVVREVAGDLVEQLTLIDSFVHPKNQRTSHCYRITYRSMDRNLTNEEIDALQEQVRLLTQERLGVELR
jgi:phenylalanyl-tRNA synthetase alpha chain